MTQQTDRLIALAMAAAFVVGSVFGAAACLGAVITFETEVADAGKQSHAHVRGARHGHYVEWLAGLHTMEPGPTALTVRRGRRAQARNSIHHSRSQILIDLPHSAKRALKLIKSLP